MYAGIAQKTPPGIHTEPRMGRSRARLQKWPQRNQHWTCGVAGCIIRRRRCCGCGADRRRSSRIRSRARDSRGAWAGNNALDREDTFMAKKRQKTMGDSLNWKGSVPAAKGRNGRPKKYTLHYKGRFIYVDPRKVKTSVRFTFAVEPGWNATAVAKAMHDKWILLRKTPKPTLYRGTLSWNLGNTFVAVHTISSPKLSGGKHVPARPKTIDVFTTLCVSTSPP